MWLVLFYLLRVTASSLGVQAVFLFFRRVREIPKGTISFVMSVRPFVRREQLGSHWADFDEIRYFSFFRNFVKKIYV